MVSKHKPYYFRPEYLKNVPIYRFRREPGQSEEIDLEQYPQFDIWRENGTVISVCHYDTTIFFQKEINFAMKTTAKKTKLFVRISGRKEAAIAETLTFFMALKHPEEYTCFEISIRHVDKFDLRAIQPEQLAQILDANPSRKVHFADGIFNAEQSVILATRPYPLDWELPMKHFRFEDDGTAFVDALEKRRSSFGSLCINCHKDDIHFTRSNLERLLNLDVLQKLKLNYLEEDLVLLPLSAKVNALDYCIDFEHIQPNAFDSLNIPAKDLTLEFYLDDFPAWSWDAPLISLLNRIADLGHFEKLTLSVDHWNHRPERMSIDKMARVADALIRAIQSNPNLQYLNLKDTEDRYDWDPHMQDVFKAMEEHKGLRTFVLRFYPFLEDRKYSWLQSLLSRNRQITVIDLCDRKCSNGPIIDKLYRLNAIYNGLASLRAESVSLRPLLVAEALVNQAKGNLPQAALLLSNHTDTLCEFIHSLNLNHIVASIESSMEETLSGAVAESGGSLKRKGTTQLSLVATKASRTSTKL
ncbi:hypothetical protein FisN_10Lu413 [Fistulifera solaris]|uniref:Uncharacterized protein n=1 Tax=Fistulifera solaris TaxID=1519565 RepID=A0A1Z5JUH9_FISSO|nr:hypothetical protein FisN_10Lu413 [Fistulifera solaris]|eukprot:GAX17693.1 hypothetical protein FisN_10Lu413 [Fistulifera solaris]